MSHVTHDTANRLEAAGFKQPEFGAGQHWYGDELIFVLSYGGSNPEFRAYGDNFSWRDEDELKVFAPTATDILKDLPGHTIHYKAKDSMGVVWSYEPDDLMFSHKSPAEAAALAYLAQKGNK